MLKIINKDRIVPFLLLTFPLVIDCLIGMQRGGDGEGDSMVGILYKGGVILYSLRFLPRNSVGKFIKILSILFIISLFYQFTFSGFNPQRIVSFIKTLYSFFLLSILLKHPQTRDSLVVTKYAVWYGVGAAFVLIVCGFWGLGYSGYEEGSLSNKGLFVAGNDLGLAMVILTCYSIYLYQITQKMIYLVHALIISVSAMQLGSLASIMGAMLVWFCFVLSVTILKTKDFKASLFLKISIVLIIVGMAYLIIPFVIQIIESDVMVLQKFDDPSLAFTEGNGRGVRKEMLLRNMANGTLLDWLFGFGNLYNDTAELDYMDLTGFYGIIIAFLIMLYPIKTIFISIKKFWQTKSILYYWAAIISGVFVGHALFAGHAYTSVLAFSYYIVCIYLLQINNHKIIK